MQASRDENRVTTLLAVSNVDGVTPVTLYADPVTHRLLVDATGGGTGTVTSISVVSANGFAGSVADATTTPAITLETTVTGILQGDGTAISAIVVGTGLDFTGGTLSATGGGLDLETNGTPNGDQTLLNLVEGANVTITDDGLGNVTIAAGGGGGGDVFKVGTPANNQIGVWTGDGTIEGANSLTYDGANFQLTGDIGSTGTRITKGWFTDLQVTNAIAGSITGNAATATALLNARTIGGVSFNGTANITVASATGGFTISGGNLALTTNSITMTGSLAATGARVTKGWFTDVESTNMYTVGGTSLTTVAQTLQNKTLTNSNNVLGGVTMTLGSDADGDTYYRAGNVLTRLAKGTAGQVLKMNAGATAPEWGAAGGSVSFGTSTQIPFMNATDDDFDYSSELVFDSSSKILTVENSVSLTNTGTTPGRLILNASSSLGGSHNVISQGTFPGLDLIIPDLSGEAALTSNPQTFTDKRITPRVASITSSATPTINTDDVDAVDITALAANITSMTTNLSGTPTNFQKLTIRIKDNGSSRTISWGAGFSENGATLPTSTVSSKLLTVGLIWNGSTWGCVAVAQEV